MLNDPFDKNNAANQRNCSISLSNLEKNCNQIFIKGNSITKDFLDKIQHEVVPEKTEFFGYQMNTKRLILLTCLILLFTVSTMGTIAMWFTDTFQKEINSRMVLSEDSQAYNIWRAPTSKPYFKIYIFNYTNVDDYESGNAEKLHVEEVGPYVYFEEIERVNVRFNKVDGTMSYQEKRTYRFSEELSNGSKDDLVMVTNVPVLAGASVAKHQFNFLMRASFSGLLTTLLEKPFIPLTVNQFVFGYDDHLYDLSKNYLKFQDKRIFDSIGLLVWKAGVQPDIYTMNTGEHNFSRLGLIEKFNGQSQLALWGSDACNNIQASDGLMHSSDLVSNKKNISIFVPQMCRKLHLQFDKEETVFDNVPVYRYKMPLDIFDSSIDNNCYCKDGICPIRGVFNATACAFNVPVFFSWPHFYNADPILFNGITGLRKDPVVNDSFVDIHSKLGMILRGKGKVQVSIQLQKSFGIAQLAPYPDELMLPMVWLESGITEKDFDAEIIHIIYQATFTVRNLELGLKYGCLLATLVTLSCILLVLKKQKKSRLRADSLRRPIDIDQ